MEACEGWPSLGFMEKTKMMAATHAAFAVLCYYVIAYFARLPIDSLMVLTFLIIGSLLPDIDHPRTFFIQQLYLFKHSKRLGKFVMHRGILHSILATLIATAVVWVIAVSYHLETLAVMCFFLGFISHLAIDSLNPAGIRWLQPFSKAKIKGEIRTGSALEKFLFVVIIVAISAIVYTMHPEWFSIFWE